MLLFPYSDSNSCLMKLGMIGETIVNLIFNYDRIPLPYDNTAVARIDTLLREDLITRDLSDILHALRKARNKAVHENYASVEEGKTLLQMAYSLCEWFMQTYGDWNYQNQPFIMPEPQAEPVDTAAEERKEDELIKEAEETAAASAKVDPNARKKQAQKAASQRVKSEAETRYMIDEQLRKVGWEADTENLRHSKGARPQKGRCMAIAEWPTDSTVGDRGFADYALFIDTQMVATIEAKAIHKDIPSVIDYQCKDYSRNIRSEDAQYQIGSWGAYKVPFTFATNGRPYLEQYETKSGIWFLDLRLPYVRDNTDDLFDLDAETAAFEREKAFTGCELVHDTHRLALMNAMLHDIEGEIMLADTLSNAGKNMKGFDLVLTNPPFGTKKGGERATRDDFTFPTSNKQLNFLQHIYRSLKADDKARAAVVLPDNVLFADGEGERIRVDLMDKCDLHTVLRLPTGIFYAQGVKTNVLFFTRGKSDKGNTKEVWFYDLRTNMPSFGKTNPLKKEDFSGFEAAFEAPDRHAVQDERWSVFTREEIAAKGNSLDLGLIRDDSIVDYEDLPDPIESGEEAIAQLEEAVDLLMSVVKELKSLQSKEA